MNRFCKKLVQTASACLIGAALLATSVGAVIPYSSYTYDSYGNAVETSDLYEPEMVLSGYDLGVNMLSQPTDMYVAQDGLLYLLDADNSRVLVLNQSFAVERVVDQILLEGQQQQLNKASGIFADRSGNIYIADTGNNRILCMDGFGKIFRVIEKPESEYFSEQVEFLPNKLVMDRANNLYVQCTGIYQGLVVFDTAYEFQGFFGSDMVETTSEALRDFFWKQFMTEEQKEAMANYVPPEIRNFDITSNDFIYTITTAQFIPLDTTKTEMDSIRCLNPKGGDTLTNKMSENAYKAMELDARALNFVDICYDEKGFINAVDSLRGKIYQFDQNMNLVTAFGALGDYKGTFTTPVSLEVSGDRILVLDKSKCNLTVFRLTETGQNVHYALELYHAGKYTEAIEPWKKVIEENTNFELAYIGVGNALYNQQDYAGAMGYFKLGRDGDKYSEAFKEYRVQLLRGNIGWIIIVLVLIFLCWFLFKNQKRLFQRKANFSKERKG